MEDKQRPPWASEKIWLAVIGLATLVVLAALHLVELDGLDITGIVAALIFGRAWEGAAARRGAP